MKGDYKLPGIDNKNNIADGVMDEKTKKSILWGATFFTATTSTVGAGFLTQTAQFAQDYKFAYFSDYSCMHNKYFHTNQCMAYIMCFKTESAGHCK